ncbi:MAG: hypothetical protein ABW092_07870 [Candidatus Thiodiazotropha sp.]
MNASIMHPGRNHKRSVRPGGIMPRYVTSDLPHFPLRGCIGVIKPGNRKPLRAYPSTHRLTRLGLLLPGETQAATRASAGVAPTQNGSSGRSVTHRASPARRLRH